MEAIPEADRVGQFPHPRETTTLFGHTKAESMLVEAFRSERLHHAWLITGPEGIGKATLAYRFARFLLAEPAERSSPQSSLAVANDSVAQRQVRVLSHPSLLVLRRPWDIQRRRLASFIPVDEVRRLRSFLGHTASEQGWRVVIVDPTDDLNPNAANAILKSLEEPPPRAIFLLIASEPGRLLPTIRSRCRTLRMNPLGPDDLRRAAQAAIADGEGGAETAVLDSKAIELAQGRVRRLLMLSMTDGLKLQDRLEATVNSPRFDWSSAYALADELAAPSAEQKLEMFFELLLELIRRIAAAPERAGTGPRWAELWEWVMREKDEVLVLNLDRRALVLEALSRLSTLSRS